MKTLGFLSAAAFVGSMSLAQAAEPVALTDSQMDQVAAGAISLFVKSGDAAAVVAQDDVFVGEVAASTNFFGETTAAGACFICDAQFAAALDDFRILRLRGN